MPVLLAPPPLANARLYIIRHAEKPETGAGLTEAGTARANAYPKFFRHDPIDGSTLRLTHVFATTDSSKSMRPRLTAEPVAKAFGLTVDTRFANKHPEELVTALRTEQDGDRILICWHHGDLPHLLAALGADPKRFVPEGAWPDAVFDRVVELRYDAEGKLDLVHSRTVAERLMPGDEPSIPAAP